MLATAPILYYRVMLMNGNITADSFEIAAVCTALIIRNFDGTGYSFGCDFEAGKTAVDITADC